VTFGARQRAGHFPEIRRPVGTVWKIELRRVGKVENLRPELHSDALRKHKVLEDGEVEIAERRSVVGVVAEITLCERSRRGEVRRIEPFRRRASTRSGKQPAHTPWQPLALTVYG
jgi:hypothetical protein